MSKKGLNSICDLISSCFLVYIRHNFWNQKYCPELQFSVHYVPALFREFTSFSGFFKNTDYYCIKNIFFSFLGISGINIESFDWNVWSPASCPTFRNRTNAVAYRFETKSRKESSHRKQLTKLIYYLIIWAALFSYLSWFRGTVFLVALVLLFTC